MIVLRNLDLPPTHLNGLLITATLLPALQELGKNSRVELGNTRSTSRIKSMLPYTNGLSLLPSQSVCHAHAVALLKIRTSPVVVKIIPQVHGKFNVRDGGGYNAEV